MWNKVKTVAISYREDATQVDLPNDTYNRPDFSWILFLTLDTLAVLTTYSIELIRAASICPPCA